MAELKSTCDRCGAFVDVGPRCEACTARAWDARLVALDRVGRRKTLWGWAGVVLFVGLPLACLIADAIAAALRR